MAAGVVAFFALAFVAHFDVDSSLAGSKFDQPLTGAGILRVGIASINHRITGPHQREQSQHRNQPDVAGLEDSFIHQQNPRDAFHNHPPGWLKQDRVHRLERVD